MASPPMTATPRRRKLREPSAARVFAVDCKLSYTLLGDTHFLFMVHALNGMDQEVLEESLRITPTLEHEVHVDEALGHRILRLKAPTGPLTLRYRAKVRLSRPTPDTSAQEVPIEALPYPVLADLMPTRYCESDRLASAAWKMFGDLPPGYSRVKAVSEWIREHVDYRTGSTDSTTTACDVFLQRAGVCRDFAHLGVAMCRALNIPARLAVGYSRFDTPPPDFHAVFEAFLGGQWELFDPTGMTDPGDMVRIAVGRDAGDVAFATLFGSVETRLIRPEVEQVRSRPARSTT
ncbi:transglutaminase family protein [Albitalea terrae]|uniref:Transglutaminase family protein n=2 Tax=Piscinibacter terrae TaxID=2496871 RepID=A0A3N7J5B8_9BURK|nr:transglutaminase family protein [Albitalea terrae]